MSRPKFFSAAVLLILLNTPGAAADETQRNTSGDARADEAPACQKRLGIKGHPHRIHSVARLSAMRAWTQKAMQYGEAYSMWHNAEAANVKCQTLPRSDYFACFATGKPCRATNAEHAASSKTR